VARLLLCSTSRVLLLAVDELARAGLVEKVAFAVSGSPGDEPIEAFGEHVDLGALTAAGLKGDFRGVEPSWLTVDLLEQLAWAETLVYPMMERLDPLRSQTFAQRRLLYQHLLCYWSGFLERTKLDVVLFGSVPHEVSDFILYALCKQRKILTLIVNYTRLPGVCYFSTEFGPHGMIRRDHSGSRELSAAVRANIAGIRRDYASAIPIDTKELLERAVFGGLPKLLDHATRVLRAPGWAARRACSVVSILANRTFDKLRDFAQRKINEAEWQAIKADYPARAEGFVTPHRYVYFLLNFQPESTTSPLGQRFVDQHIAVAMLARYLPAECTIVVKEHPAQLLEFDHYNYLGRDRSFYERLSQVSRVRFAPTNADHFKLLDGALLVASVNGTAGWEAVVRRKPAIVFGEAWYQNAPGVFRIRTDSDCAAAIERILQNKVLIDDEMVDRFIEEFISCCEYLCTTEEEARFGGIPFDVEQNVAIARDAIAAGLWQVC
jgi:hypothetical protein